MGLVQVIVRTAAKTVVVGEADVLADPAAPAADQGERAPLRWREHSELLTVRSPLWSVWMLDGR